MPFRDFLGNEPTVRHLRESIAAGRLPHSLILAGPRGSGKYTLAIMLAQTANCLNPQTSDNLPDFCGHCSNCQRIAQALDLDARIAEAIAAREDLREADKRDTRILIQTHPDVLVIPPDPPQLLIKIGQVRVLTREIYRVPAEARRAFSIFTSASFMKDAANSLLKVLEEPPPHATIILLAENTGELLPTIRSRAQIFRLGAIPTDQIEKLLAERHPHSKPPERALISRLAEGAIGRALHFDLPAYLASRADASSCCVTQAGRTTHRTSSKSPKPTAPEPKARKKPKPSSAPHPRSSKIYCSSNPKPRTSSATSISNANSLPCPPPSPSTGSNPQPAASARSNPACAGTSSAPSPSTASPPN